MDNVFDVFKNEQFSMVSLTTHFLQKEYIPMQISSLNLFQESRVATTTVLIEESTGILRLLPAAQRGEHGSDYDLTRRKIRSIPILHIPEHDKIHADQIQNVREFGTSNMMESAMSVVDEHVMGMNDNQDATCEHLMLGALKGIIYDADGTTPLINLFTEFGVTRPAEVNFQLTMANPPEDLIHKKCNGIFRSMQDALKMRPMRGIHAFCGPEFYDSLVGHKEVKEAYRRHQSEHGQQTGAFLRGGHARKMFTIYNILFEEYRGTIGDVKFVEDDKAHFFPRGTRGVFKMHYGPADYNETVNQLGLPRYTKIAPDPYFNKFMMIEVQSNPLPLCHIPQVLIGGRRA